MFQNPMPGVYWRVVVIVGILLGWMTVAPLKVVAAASRIQPTDPAILPANEPPPDDEPGEDRNPERPTLEASPGFYSLSLTNIHTLLTNSQVLTLTVQGVQADSEPPIPASVDARTLGINLPPYQQGDTEVRNNRKVIELLATDQVPGILLAASIANQSNTYQRPFGWDGLERVQLQLGLGGEPSVGIGQIMPVEAREFGYQGDVWNLFDDQVSIRLMAAKLQRTARAVSELGVDPTEIFVLTSIGNNMGDTVVDRYKANGQSVESLLENDEEARTQLQKMMSWTEYLVENQGWAFPEDVDTNRVWQMLWDAYQQ